MIPGIDVSNWQAGIDWPQVAAAGYGLAIAKCSEGTTYADPYFPANWQGIRAAGMVRGAYHFAQPNANTADAEAAYFLQTLTAAGGLQRGDLVALDLEAGSGNLLGWAVAWLQTVEAAVGFKPLLYSSVGFMQPHGLLGSAILGQYGLWLASYSSTFPAAPAGWSVVAFWQSSDSGTVPGVSGHCDLTSFNGTAAQLALYGMPEPPPKPVFDAAARLQLVGYVAGGSSAADIAAWVQQYE